MPDYLQQHWDMLISRPYGPLAARLIIQPLVAAIFGVRAGLVDARARRSPYGWLVITGEDHRRALLRGGWLDIRRVFFAAFLVDVIYELIELHWIYPGQAIIVAAAVALPSYALVRSWTNRLTRRSRDSNPTTTAV
jgi:hypothetical protein